MENRINFLHTSNPYLQLFQIAQVNLNQLVKEERIRKRLQKSKKQLSASAYS